MGLSFSRSIKFGPMRFNFSGSGIGVSTGVPGFRIGTGPRGAYISAGAGGFRYRTSLGGARPVGRTPLHRATTPVPLVGDANIYGVRAHDTINILSLSDSSDDDLLNTMNEQAQRRMVWPFAAIGVTLLIIVSLLPDIFIPGWARLSFLVVGVGVVLWVRKRDHIKGLTVLFYEPDEPTTNRFSDVLAAAGLARTSYKLQSVVRTASYADRRYTAGATNGLTFGPASLVIGRPKGIVANIAVPVLATGRTTFAFYPDRVLALQGSTIGAIDYDDLTVESRWTSFVENGRPPADAKVTGHTWQYVNKNGTPDRRFKNNFQRPICRYNEFNLSSSKGLDVRFMGSRDEAFDALAEALKKMVGLRAAKPMLQGHASSPPAPENRPALVSTPGRRIADW